MTFIEFMSSVNSGAVTIAALVGACVAYRGLDTWKKQLSGHTNHDLARRLLISIFKKRNSISMVRHPFMRAEEMRTDDQSEELSSLDMAERARSAIDAYQRRWQKFSDLDAEVKSLLVESEALWGSDLTKLLGEVEKLEHELFVTLRLFLQLKNPDENEETKQTVGKMFNERRYIIYERVENDEFRNEYSEALEPVKNYLRVKLGDRSQ